MPHPTSRGWMMVQILMISSDIQGIHFSFCKMKRKRIELNFQVHSYHFILCCIHMSLYILDRQKYYFRLRVLFEKKIL